MTAQPLPTSAESPLDNRSGVQGQSPAQPAQPLGALGAQLGPMLPMLLKQAAARMKLASASDFDDLAKRIVDADPWLARRLAFAVVKASVRELGGFEPSELEVRARLPIDAPQFHETRDGWILVREVPRT